MHATMTSKGQLTVPKAVREQLGLHAGDRVEFVRGKDGTYSIVPRSGTFDDLLGIVKTDIVLDDAQLRRAIDDARAGRGERAEHSERAGHGERAGRGERGVREGET